MLRVEGGFGKALETIISAAPKIQDLYLTFSISSSDNVQGLCNSLPSTNPRRLIVHESAECLSGGKHALDNAKTRDLTATVCACIRKNWTNLRVCHIPDEGGTQATINRVNALSAALRHASNLETVVIPYAPMSHITHNILEGFAANPNLKTVRLLATHDEVAGTYFFTFLNRMPHIDKLIMYQEPPPQDALKKQNAKDISRVLTNSYVCLAASPRVVRAHIWSRVLALAMDADNDGCHIERTRQMRSKAKPSRGRLHFLLICKELYELALPLLYRSPAVDTFDGLQSLSNRLSEQPSLGCEIRVLVLNRCITDNFWPLLEEESDHDVSDVHPLVKNILSKTPNLQQLVTNRRALFDRAPFLMDWSVWETLTNVPGASLKTLSGFQVKGEGKKTLSIFNNLTAIRSLEWFDRTVFRRGNAVSPTCLSLLEELRLKEYDDSLLSQLTRISLPSLRIAAFADYQFGKTPQSLRPFLAKHGSKLQRLEFLSGCLNIASLFNLCPNVTEFLVDMDVASSVSSADITVLLSHLHDGESAKLRKIIIECSTSSFRVYDDVASTGAGASQVFGIWGSFFDSLDLSSLPALEEIQIMRSLWPSNQRAYAKNPWIKWDADLRKQWNVALLDAKGKGWTARIK